MTATPLYLATLRSQAGAEARRIVRAGLRYCGTCGAVLGDRCRTRSGRVAARHVGRAA